MFVIAGANGHVGGVAADQLLNKGQNIKVIVRNAEKGAAWSKRGAEVAVGSLDDPTFLTGALRGARALFTLLPPPSFSEPDFYAAQRRTADSIAAAVAANKVPHVVLLSSIGADLADGTGPIKGLHYLENKLRDAGTKLTALRAGYFQENVGNYLQPAKQAGILPSFGMPEDMPMPMIATKDIGMLATEKLLSPPASSEVIDLVGPSYSVRQVADKLGTALGKQLQIINVPQPGWVDAMMQGGLPRPFAEAFAEMYGAFGKGTIQPKGDQLVQGRTELDEVIQTITR